MILILPAPEPLNGARLVEELAAVGVSVGRSTMTLRDGQLYLDVPDNKRTVVEQTVSSHTGAPTAPPAEDTRLDQVRAKADAILADPAGSADWTALERKVVLAALVKRVLR